MELAIPLLLMWLFARSSTTTKPGPAPTLAPPPVRPPPGPRPQPQPAAARPPTTTTSPGFFPSPTTAAQNANNAAQAAQAAKTTAILTKAAATAPAPFPAVLPSGLAPFPSGWKPHPRPGTVAVRAMQLLPVLWARGKGSRTVEKAGGEWVSFVAQETSPGKKGVTAWVEKQAQPGLANA